MRGDVGALPKGMWKSALAMGAASRGSRMRKPAVSKEGARCQAPAHACGHQPDAEASECEARKPVSPQSAAGTRMEPPVSVPMAARAEPS